jgi:(4-(4-[2-(gamma-L-glutamylamino)ethyl]phenoxymethyl)furan-2-yl)methanamine synthase
MSTDTLGWDLGGAHLKAVWLDRAGRVVRAVQLPCPLWQGMCHLEQAVQAVLACENVASARHAVTMTGELADIFASREEGVAALIKTMCEALRGSPLFFYAGANGFVTSDRVAATQVASANWRASASFAALRCDSGLIIDIGSTTTDLSILSDGKVHARGEGDHARLVYDELLYTGAVRTPLIAVASRAPWKGEWASLMAEHFATMADAYRLTRELPDHADQMETADHRGKTEVASAQRLSRILGLDFDSANLAAWRRVARWFAERQLIRIEDAAERTLSRGLLAEDAPLIGAGVGSFVVAKLAMRLGRPYLDFSELVDTVMTESRWISACAPAFAVGWLLQQERGAGIGD